MSWIESYKSSIIPGLENISKYTNTPTINNTKSLSHIYSRQHTSANQQRSTVSTKTSAAYKMRLALRFQHSDISEPHAQDIVPSIIEDEAFEQQYTVESDIARTLTRGYAIPALRRTPDDIGNMAMWKYLDDREPLVNSRPIPPRPPTPGSGPRPGPLPPRPGPTPPPSP